MFNKQLTKLNQLGGHFHCSIVGTCLTLDELRQLYKKFSKATLTDYALHHFFVGIACESSYANKRLQKLLDKKYQLTIKEFAKADSDIEIKILWQKYLKLGKVADAFWAAATHPNISDALRDEIYGKIHMLSHLSGASIRVDMLELNRLRKRNRELEQQIHDEHDNFQHRLQTKDKSIAILEKRWNKAIKTNSKLEQLQKQIDSYEQEPLIQQLKRHQKELFNKLATEQTCTKHLVTDLQNCQSHVTVTEERCVNLEQQLSQTIQERDSLEASLSNLCSDTCTQDCPNKDLCGRYILFVGGRTNLCRHFDSMVKQYNGNFIYHDGGREDGDFKLESNLAKADAILCPLDCISHEAMNKIKRYCENNTKELVMMPRASLSAFVNGLNQVIH